MKRLLCLILTLLLWISGSISPASAAAGDTASENHVKHRMLENIPLIVDNGAPKIIRALHYSYANNRYLSLRDLASALDGSPRQFDLTVSDGLTDITTQKGYTPVGGENTPFPDTMGEDYPYETESLAIKPLTLDGRELKYYGFLGRNAADREDCFLNLTDLAMQLDLSLQLSDGNLILDTAGHFTVDQQALDEDRFYFELHSAIAGDISTGEIFDSWEPDLSVPIASTTKLMTYIIIKDLLAQGVISPEDNVMITREADIMSHSDDGEIDLETGEEVPVNELIYGMLIPSSDECALALAIHAAGSETAFIRMMQKKAEDLGLSDKVRFFNCHGLPVYTDNMYTTKIQNRMTANDMFLLVRYLMETYPEITGITSRKTAYLKTLDITVRNTNALLYNVPGVIGLKTGTTDMARNCLVALMEAEDSKGKQHYLVAVQFGAEDETVRTSVTEELIRYAKQRLMMQDRP